MKRLGLWAAAAMLALASGGGWAQDRGSRDGWRGGERAQRGDHRGDRAQRSDWSRGERAQRRDGSREWRDGHRGGWHGDRHYGRHWSRPYYPRYGWRDWEPRYDWSGPGYYDDWGYPGWLYPPSYLDPYVEWEPPVYVDRYIEREPVLIEREYEEPPGRSERSYAQAEQPRARQPERRMRLQRQTLSATELFGFDQATLRMPQPKLDEIARAMRRDPQIDNVTITGYTDRIGAEAYNLKLSRQRAEAVKAYLAGKGIEPRRLQAVGRGEADPVVQCDEKDQGALIKCLEPNRRVEVQQITVEARR